MAPGSNNDTYSSCHRLLLESEVYFIYRAPDFSCSSMLRTHFSWIIQRWAKLGSSASHLPVQHPHMWRLQRCVLCAEHKKRSIQGHSQARCAQVRSRPMLKKYSEGFIYSLLQTVYSPSIDLLWLHQQWGMLSHYTSMGLVGTIKLHYNRQ